MTWGQGAWGTSSWGSIDPASLDVPQIVSVDPIVVELRGGTVIRINGKRFVFPLDVEVLSGSVGAPELVGRAHIADPEFDVTNPEPYQGYRTIYAGLPAVPQAGTYHLRVTAAGQASALLADALDYRLHSEEQKVHRARTGFGVSWDTGDRVLARAKSGGLV